MAEGLVQAWQAWGVREPAAEQAFPVGLVCALSMALWSAFAMLALRGAPVPARPGPPRQPRQHRRVRPTPASLAAACTALLSGGAPFALDLSFDPLALLQGAASLFLLLLVIFSVALEPERRWATLHLCIALTGLAVLGLIRSLQTMAALDLPSALPVAAGWLSLAALPLVMVSAVRHPGWRSGLRISRDAMLSAVAPMACGMLGAMAVILSRDAGNDTAAGTPALAAASGLTATLALLSMTVPSWRQRTRLLLSKHFYTFRIDYRAEWMQLTRRLLEPTSATSNRLGDRCLSALCGTLGSPSGVLWTGSLECGFRLEACQGQAGAAETLHPGAAGEWLARHDWIIDIDEWRRHPGHYPGLDLPCSMVTMDGAWLLLPLRDRSRLIGMALLTRPADGTCFDWETRDLLTAASRQVAGLLALADASRRIAQAERFDTFNRHAAFALHDLKTLVTELNLLTESAHRHGGNPAFQAEWQAMVGRVAHRMRGLMEGLQRTPTSHRSWVPITPVLEAALLTPAGLLPQPVLEAPDARVGETSVQADPVRLERILRNLVRNAIEASTDSGTVRIQASVQRSTLCIRITDSGPGVSPFFADPGRAEPFVTTKAGGLGLGLFECRQYLSELGGRLRVDSRAGRGSTWTLELPCKRVCEAVCEPTE